VVIADLGSAELAWPEERFLEKPAPNDRTVPICTVTYRAPDLLLGSERFGPDLDMWSFGCVAAELFLRDEPLFHPHTGGSKQEELLILEAQFRLLGTPAKDTSTFAWMKSLPFFAKFCGQDGSKLRTKGSSEWPPKRMRGSPPQLEDLVAKTLQWKPEERLSAASACLHSFITSSPLSVQIAARKGKNGLGTIAEGFLDEEVLEYLQKCPTWPQWHEECRQNNFQTTTAKQSVRAAERELHMKREFVGYIDAKNPPTCKSLNSDANIPLIQSERLAMFVKAFRRGAKTWLHQLTARVRGAIAREGLPAEFLAANGLVFTEEDFADNALVYASVQLLRIGEREDGWHTDGGSSLLHAALTIFGSRHVQVKLEDGSCISLPQRPGSFYIGNLCAMSHNVVHGEHAAGSFGDGPPSKQVQIAVMLRSDVFRNARARKINATPGPLELFRIVNTETAKHLSEQPLYLPDLAAVMAEATS
jgi:hypothetical protein